MTTTLRGQAASCEPMLIAFILPGRASGPARREVTGVRYRLEVRLTPADVGQRVVIRWRA